MLLCFCAAASRSCLRHPRASASGDLWPSATEAVLSEATFKSAGFRVRPTSANSTADAAAVSFEACTFPLVFPAGPLPAPVTFGWERLLLVSAAAAACDDPVLSWRVTRMWRPAAFSPRLPGTTSGPFCDPWPRRDRSTLGRDACSRRGACSCASSRRSAGPLYRGPGGDVRLKM